MIRRVTLPTAIFWATFYCGLINSVTYNEKNLKSMRKGLDTWKQLYQIYFVHTTESFSHFCMQLKT